MNTLYIRLLMFMYINQKLRVTFNGNSSEWFNVTNGGKQGGVLSPTLFSVYIDGMLLQMKESGSGCHIGDVCCGGLGYTNDLTLLIPTVKCLKKIIHVCEKYAIEFNITFNGSKSQLVIFGGGQHQCDIYVGRNKVDIVTCMRYLGHTVTNDINDSLVKPVINYFNVKVNTCLAYFNDVACNIKNTLFKQYCTSFYGSHLCTLFDREIKDFQYKCFLNSIFIHSRKTS